jgi:hypothetical protein
MSLPRVVFDLLKYIDVLIGAKASSERINPWTKLVLARRQVRAKEEGAKTKQQEAKARLLYRSAELFFLATSPSY